MYTESKTVNPFTSDPREEESDNELIASALSGDRDALESLLVRHQPWIYNLAFRMVMVAADAQDITQEILVKILTKLSSFDRIALPVRYRVVPVP